MDGLDTTSRWTSLSTRYGLTVEVLDLELMGDRMRDMQLYKTPDPVDLYTVVQFTSWDHAEKRAPFCTYESEDLAKQQLDYYRSKARGGNYYRILHTRINPDTSVTTDWLTYGT